MHGWRTCLMRGSRVLSTERVFIWERSKSGRPAAAMVGAGAGATARVRAHAAAAAPLAAGRRHVAPARPTRAARPP